MSYILFHSAGTAGDYITCLLTRTGKYYSRCDYEDIDETGKCHPKAIAFYIKLKKKNVK